MSSELNRLSFKKEEWRNHNFSAVQRSLYDHGPLSETVGWLEAFGASGPAAMAQTIAAGLISGPEQFYGVDNNHAIYTKYMTELPLDESPRLFLGDVYAKSVELTDAHTIGVLNYDMLGLAGHHWDSQESESIQRALLNCLEKLPACFLIVNCAAETPSGQYRDVSGILNTHHEKVLRCLAGLGRSYRCHVEAPRVPADPQALKLSRGDFKALNKNYELYKAEDHYLRMVTLRVGIERK